jgi:hypothetical protein
LIAERQNDHRGDEQRRYSAKRFCRCGRFCQRRFLRQPALDPRYVASGISRHPGGVAETPVKMALSAFRGGSTGARTRTKFRQTPGFVGKKYRKKYRTASAVRGLFTTAGGGIWGAKR